MPSSLQPDQAQSQSILKTIHQGLEEEESFEAWAERIRFVYPTRIGGLALIVDEEDPGLWWVKLYSPGCMPSIRTLGELTKLCAVLGCKYLAVHTEIELIKRLMQKLGWQQIEEDLFSIKCQ